MTPADFTPGMRVRYIGRAKPENFGRLATVVRYVKSRNVVTVDFEGLPLRQARYDAYPQSLEPCDLATMAQRKAAAPLKPAKPQAPCDVGLFSDDARQLDLVTLSQGRK